MREDLLAITYSEFDNIAGPVLKHCFPPDVVTKEAFEPISDYVIMAKHLCNKLITVRQEKWQFMSFPLAIENDKYVRNTLSFSFSFVLGNSCDTNEFGKLLKRVATYFQEIEVEREFLFNPWTNSLLPSLLESIFTNLTTKGNCYMQIYHTPPSCLALKLIQNPPLLRVIEDFEVPIFRRDRIALNQLPWDISFQHLILHIDGINHVKRIVDDADMDIDFVKRSLALLEYHGAIIIADVFRFSNVYKLHSDYGINALMDASVVQEMIDFSVITDSSTATTSSSKAPPPSQSAAQQQQSQLPAHTAAMIVEFMLNLQLGVTVAQALVLTLQLQEEHQQQQPEAQRRSFLRGIDLSRLIAIARANGILKRQYEYPIYGGASAVTFKPHHLSHQEQFLGAGSEEDFQIPSKEAQALGGGRSGVPGLNLRSRSSSSQQQPLQVPKSDSFADFRTSSTMRFESTEPLSTGTSYNSDHNRSFAKLINRAKSVVGRSYLRGEEASQQPLIDLETIVQKLDGSECLDAICCRFGLSFLDVMRHPLVIIVYK